MEIFFFYGTLRLIRLAVWIGLLSVVVGCAFAPLSTLQTARSSGSGHVTLDAGATGNLQVPAVKIMVGVSENLDLGLQTEFIDSGIVAKYSFVNNRAEGFSFAGLLSYGSAPNGNYYFGGPVLSYKTGSFEPFLTVRYNSVTFNGTSVNLGSLGTATILKTSFSYLQYSLGTAVWFVDSFGLLIEYTTLGSSADFQISQGGFISASLVFRF